MQVSLAVIGAKLLKLPKQILSLFQIAVLLIESGKSNKFIVRKATCFMTIITLYRI